MTISSASNSIQLLSNIGDLELATSTSATVLVKYGTETVLSETLYADADGKVWLRDVRGLLLPYMRPGTLETFTVKVGDTIYTMQVMYCLAVLDKTSDTAMTDVLPANFLTTCQRKIIGRDSRELLPMFAYSAETSTIALTITVAYCKDGVDGTVSVSNNVPVPANTSVMYVDVSPTVIQGKVATAVSATASDIVLYGYAVERVSGEFEALQEYVVTDFGGKMAEVKYLNHFGVEEYAAVRGASVMANGYDIASAYVTGRMSRLDCQLTKAFAFTLPLASDTDQLVAENLIASDAVSILMADGSWREIAITEATQEVDEQEDAENVIQFTYQWRDRNHRRFQWENGTTDAPADALYDINNNLLTDVNDNILTSL